MKDSPSPHRFVASHLLQVPRSGIRDFFEIVATRDDVLSLGIGEPDFVTPWQIRDAAIYALDHGATSYTPNRGQRVCRRAIAGYLESSFGLAYDPDQEILVTVGVSEALDLAVRAVAASTSSSPATRCSITNPAMSPTVPWLPSPTACRFRSPRRPPKTLSCAAANWMPLSVIAPRR